MRNRMGLSFSQSSASFTTGGVTFAGAAVSAALVSTARSGSKGFVSRGSVLEAWSGVVAKAVVFTRAGLRGLVCVAGRAEDRAEDFAGERLRVSAAAGFADGEAGGVSTGVAFLPKLFPAGLAVLALTIAGSLAAGFFRADADRLGRAATSGTGVSPGL